VKVSRAASAPADLSRRIKHVWTALGRSPRGDLEITKRKACRNANYPKKPGETGEPEAVSRLVHRARPVPQRLRNHPELEEHPMQKLTLSALAVLISSTAASTAFAQDVAAGKTSFNKCLACHAIGDGAKNKVGPELNGLDGRKSGTAPDYSYSDANKNSGITWNEAQFKEYIRDPKAKIPGTKMIFAGIKNETEVNDLWAFISQYDKDGKTK
jgi:cytochrome c